MINITYYLNCLKPTRPKSNININPFESIGIVITSILTPLANKTGKPTRSPDAAIGVT